MDQALTHASAGGRVRPDNERLEFLGDRVLGLLTAEALYRQHPQAREGDLAPRLNALVRRDACAEIAEEINLGARLRLSRAEAATGGRHKRALLGDAVEALIAAAYLDGGLEAARGVYEKLWADRLARQPSAPVIDAKTALQEFAQACGEPLPTYTLVSRDGPDHAPLFVVRVRMAGGGVAEGQGASKRREEQQAADALLRAVTGRDDTDADVDGEA